MTSISERPEFSSVSPSSESVARLDPRAQRGVDQALRLAVGALRVPLALFALHGPDRAVRLIRRAESGAWESIEGAPLEQALANQVIAAAGDGEDRRRAPVRGRVSLAQLGVLEYWALPILIGEERIGAFAVIDRRQRAWETEHAAILADIAGVIAGEVEWHRARYAARVDDADHLTTALLEISGEGIAVFDTERRCRIWNPCLARLTGRSREHTVGGHASSLESLLPIPDLDLLVTRALEGKSASWEGQFNRYGSVDGDPQFVSARVAPLRTADGEGTGAVVVVSDTTPAMTETRGRRRLQEMYRRLTEYSAELVTVIAPDGTVLFDSLSNERVAGYAPDELLGTLLLDLVHPDDVAQVQEMLDRIVAGERDTLTVEYRFRHKNGGWRRLLSVCRNLSDDPFVGGIVLNSRDISEWRALEAQLHEAHKMDALGRLAAGIAHDFNNLLTAIRGNVQLLQMDAASDSPMHEGLEEIDLVTGRAAQLTKRLLSFGSRQAAAPSVLDLAEVVRGTTLMLKRLVGDARLVVECSGECMVLVDATMLEQVLVNLVINARDAMPDGGTIVVECGQAEAPAEFVLVQPDTGEHCVRLTVSDKGEGMDAATKERIFEPFFTTKSSGRGTGLGLATVYAIVRQSGGFISVHSTPGEGTRFELYFPVVERNVANVATVAERTG
ncbi:MAG TPA: PAS domain S-box protein [Gemmatimonadaceae bacterium]|nr:PAS domain S-box protein [Gemmatimonadaceae bacterium]